MSEPWKVCPLCGKMHRKEYDASEDEGYAILGKFRIVDIKKESGKWLVRWDKAQILTNETEKPRNRVLNFLSKLTEKVN